MSESREKTMRLTHIALLIAMNCISAYLIIPLPFSQSPLALQTLIVNLVAFLLPPKDAAITMLAYIGIGLIGVPVFTAGTSGPGKMFGPTGGYIWAYGIPIIYLGGAIQLHFVTEMPWAAVITSGVLPFIPLDIVKSILAAILAKPLLNIIAIRNTQP